MNRFCLFLNRAKGRPEITIVSARPMDSSEVIPPPSNTNQPASATQIPTIPLKPGRKPKGREPPPRPKSRPVSELNLGTDEKNEGAISGEGASVHEPAEKGRERERSNGVEVPKKGPVSRISAPVAPVRKISKDEAEESDIVGRNLNPFFNDNLESNGEVEPDTMKGLPVVKKPVPKPTVIRPKLKEKEKNNSDPIVDDDEQNGVCSVITIHDGATGKKSKPTVIVPAKTAKKKADDTEGLKGKQDKKEEFGEKPKPDNSDGRKPPPPAKKPKPPVKPKPYSSSETPSKLSTEEAPKEITAAPKPKSRPTVIVAARPPKKSEAVRPGEESSANKDQEDKPPLKSPNTNESTQNMQEAKTKETAVDSPAVKPRRVPTVITASRPDSPSPHAERKPPKRPKRGPSIKAAPRRPISAPSEENQNFGALSTDSQDELNTRVSQQDAETLQQKSPKPRRPVSLPGVKGREALTTAEKASDASSPPEETSNQTRKNSKKRPPPPRPPAVDNAGKPVVHSEPQDSSDKSKGRGKPPPPRPLAVGHAGNKIDTAESAITDVHDSSEKSKRSKPPPRPPAASHAGDGPASTPEEDKTVMQDFDDKKSKKKNRPPRPSFKVIDTKQSRGGKEEGQADEKRKPAKPVPVDPLGTNLTKTNVTETRTVAESSADNHVKDMSQTRNSERRGDGSATEDHEEERNEQASSKTKAKPARPPSSSVSIKSKPRRPSTSGEK